MERGKILRLVAIPLLVGLVVTLIASRLLAQGEKQPTASSVEMAQIVVVTTTTTIPVHTKLAPAHVGMKEFPKAALTGREFSDLNEVLGQITLVALDPGEIVLKSRVQPEGQGALPYRIPDGQRAVTFRIDELSGVGGYPEPGDLIDLVLFLPAKEQDRPTASSRMLYESVQVLEKGPASGAKVNGSPDAPKLSSLTVALRPEAAVEVSLAEQIGVIKVLLRPALKQPDAGRILTNESRYSAASNPGPTTNR